MDLSGATGCWRQTLNSLGREFTVAQKLHFRQEECDKHIHNRALHKKWHFGSCINNTSCSVWPGNFCRRRIWGNPELILRVQCIQTPVPFYDYNTPNSPVLCIFTQDTCVLILHNEVGDPAILFHCNTENHPITQFFAAVFNPAEPFQPTISSHQLSPCIFTITQLPLCTTQPPPTNPGSHYLPFLWSIIHMLLLTSSLPWSHPHTQLCSQ